MLMKKFLLFEHDKDKNTFELFCVFNGKSIDSLRNEIVCEIKKDIYLKAQYSCCSVFVSLGIPESHKTFIEYKILRFLSYIYTKIIFNMHIKFASER